MKLLSALIAAAGLASAATIPGQTSEVRTRELETFQRFEERSSILPRQSLTRDELLNGGTCPTAILIYARGSTEDGNLGDLGVILGEALEAHYGDVNVWVQGVGGDYKALLINNFATKGTTQAAIDEMKDLLTLANTNCPDSAIVAGGYSQGAALAAYAISESNSTIQDQVVGAVLFGYTKNEQNDGEIPGFPTSKTQVYCASGDLVCEGTLFITLAHFSYDDEAAEEAPEFLISKIG